MLSVRVDINAFATLVLAIIITHFLSSTLILNQFSNFTPLWILHLISFRIINCDIHIAHIRAKVRQNGKNSEPYCNVWKMCDEIMDEQMKNMELE